VSHPDRTDCPLCGYVDAQPDGVDVWCPFCGNVTASDIDEMEGNFVENMCALVGLDASVRATVEGVSGARVEASPRATGEG
jgi:hypothetical protein